MHRSAKESHAPLRSWMPCAQAWLAQMGRTPAQLRQWLDVDGEAPDWLRSQVAHPPDVSVRVTQQAVVYADALNPRAKIRSFHSYVRPQVQRCVHLTCAAL